MGKYNENSRVLYETDKVVVILTGLKQKSLNTKTGGLLQTYILVKAVPPVDAVKMGLDQLICGDCGHRGDGKGKGRSCYVNIGQGPYAVWKSWKAGRIRPLTYPERTIFDNVKLRWGTYGDPVKVPHSLVEDINDRVDSFVGYTHQADKYPEHASTFMVSVDSKTEAARWQERGYKTFRMTHDTGDRLPDERLCPAYTGVTCEQCMACSQRAEYSRVIEVHGTGKNNFVEPPEHV